MGFCEKSLCVTVLLVVALQQVVARDCSDIEGITDCDWCSSCGGHWCKEPVNVQAVPVVHCSRTWTEGWCFDNVADETVFLNVTSVSVSPRKLDRLITVGIPHRIPYTPSSQIKIETDTKLDFRNKTFCHNNNCYIEVLAGKDFCALSPQEAFVNANIQIEGLSEDVMVTYQVSCSCQCNDDVLKDADFCNKNGNFSCGVCVCNKDWSGETCSKRCPAKRGDESEDPCVHPAKPNVQCSGNGVCGTCQECRCNSEGEGSQYFLSENLCIDLCSYINYDYDECIGRTELGLCPHHAGVQPLTLQACNATLKEEKDYLNRSIWVSCSGSVSNGVQVEYSAMRDGNNELFVMVGACGANQGSIVYYPNSVKVPIIVGLLVAAAMVAAAAGYMVWKQRSPPPVHSAQLDNFDAENCTGRNPLYKPPTSFFKNPTYGKL